MAKYDCDCPLGLSFNIIYSEVSYGLRSEPMNRHCHRGRGTL